MTAFLDSPAIAVVGVSENPRKFGAVIYRELKNRGRKVAAVHPSRTTVDGDPCYPSVAALPPEFDAVISVVPPAATEQTVDQCITRGIRRIWMQQGSESRKAIEKAEQAGISVVHGECLLMFLEPVGSVHAVHRFLAELFRRYPR
jgi:hypothetical protein